MTADCPLCRLARDEAGAGFVARLAASTVVLDSDQKYRGKTIVVAADHVTDFLDMAEADCQRLYADVLRVARAMRRVLAPARLNYAAFGNAEPHLHWHVFPRTPGDEGWGGAPQFETPPRHLDEAEMRQLAVALRQVL